MNFKEAQAIVTKADALKRELRTACDNWISRKRDDLNYRFSDDEIDAERLRRVGEAFRKYTTYRKEVGIDPTE